MFVPSSDYDIPAVFRCQVRLDGGERKTAPLLGRRAALRPELVRETAQNMAEPECRCSGTARPCCVVSGIRAPLQRTADTQKPVVRVGTRTGSCTVRMPNALNARIRQSDHPSNNRCANGDTSTTRTHGARRSMSTHHPKTVSMLLGGTTHDRSLYDRQRVACSWCTHTPLTHPPIRASHSTTVNCPRQTLRLLVDVRVCHSSSFPFLSHLLRSPPPLPSPWLASSYPYCCCCPC